MISRITSRLARLGATAVLAIGLAAGSASAEEFAKDHLAAARAAVIASKANEGFDEILIGVTAQTKQALVRRNPSVSAQIEAATNAAALELVAKRADLDNQVTEIWAARFSKAELEEITKFYNSPVGQKFTKEIGGMAQMIGMAAQVWQKKIGEEMVAKVRAEMKKKGVDL